MAQAASVALGARVGLKKKGRKRCLSPSKRPPWNPDTNCQDIFERAGRDRRESEKGERGGEGGGLCPEANLPSVVRRIGRLGASAAPPILAQQLHTQVSYVSHTHADRRVDDQTPR